MKYTNEHLEKLQTKHTERMKAKKRIFPLLNAPVLVSQKNVKRWKGLKTK